MFKNKATIILATLLSVSFSACGGRVPVGGVPGGGTKPTTPASPQPSTPADPLPTGQPTPDPGGDKPPAVDPPDDGSGDLPHPPPPDPQQPSTDADFFNLMKRFGFTKSKEELTAEIKKGISLKVADWSPGTQKSKQKNIEAKFLASQKYFDPKIKDINEYVARSMALAGKKDGVDFYLDVTYGPKGGSINLQKVDAKSLEILFFNKSGLVTNYTQTKGSLLRLAHFMLIPPTVYSGKQAAASSMYSAGRW